jgi:hypothetical protein
MNFVCFPCYNKPFSLLLKCGFCISDDENKKQSSPDILISPDRKRSRGQQLKAPSNVLKQLSKDVQKKLLISPFRKISRGKQKSSTIAYSPPKKSIGE